MGSMIGPITLTVGSPYKVSLAQDTAYIELQNDSLYDVWVFFGEVEPTDTTNANNTWHRVVRRQHNGVLPVEGYRGASAAERRNNTIGAFKGTVWLLAVDPGSLATTGTYSGRSQVYLTPYAQGDSLPAHSSLSTQTDLTSQPRIVVVPISPDDTLTGRWLAAGASPLALATYGLNTDQQASHFGPFYVFYANLTADAGGAGGFTFTLELQPQDASSVNLGAPIVVAFGGVQASVPWVCAPAWPMRVPTVSNPYPSGTTRYVVQLRAQAGTRIDLSYTISIGHDQTNLNNVPSIGEPSLAVSRVGGIASSY